MTFFIHTPKAVRYGHPGDRLFLTVASTGGKRPEYLAWKCEITKQGIVHPGYKKPLSIADLNAGKGSRFTSRNGSEPTAEFHKDSFYKEVTTADIELLISKAPDSDAVKKKALVEIFKEVGLKLTKAERHAVFKVFVNDVLHREHAYLWHDSSK